MAPRLNIPFVLEVPLDTPDGAGGVTRVWTSVGTIWGELRTGRGRERLEGDVGVAQATHTIMLRGAPISAPSRPDPRHRLRRGTRVFRVIGVREADASAKYLECRVIEEVTA